MLQIYLKLEALKFRVLCFKLTSSSSSSIRSKVCGFIMTEGHSGGFRAARLPRQATHAVCAVSL